MVDQRTRTNAVISYFFLGWMFLLARRNPAFAHPFVRRHAWQATRIHAGFVAGLALVSFVFSRTLSVTFGVLPFTLGSILTFALYAVTVALIAHGAVRASRDGSDPERPVDRAPSFFSRSHVIADEREAAMTVLGLVPLACFFVHARHRGPAVTDAVRIGTAFSLLFALVGFWSSAYVVSMALALACSVVIAWGGVSTFFSRRLDLPSWVAHLPLPFEWSAYMRIAIAAIAAVGAVLAGRRDSLSFGTLAVEAVLTSERRKREYLESHPDRSFPLPPELLVLPAVQILFAVLVLGRPAGVYRFFYGQTLLLSLVAAAAWFFGVNVVFSLCGLVLVLAIASVRTAPEAELPVFGLLADLLSRCWGMFFRRRDALAEKAATKRVTYQVDPLSGPHDE